MPCNSDYMAASGQELESKRVCGLLVYLCGRINKPIPKWIFEAVEDYYGNVQRLDEETKMLCECLRSLTEKEKELYIYNAHDKSSRDLANWWERHQEWDARRIKEENETRRKIIHKERALKKLTTDEIEALGLND